MELHRPSAPSVRILFCGRPALTSGVVNLSLLLGGDGQYCLAEKRKARLPPGDSHDGSQGDAAKYTRADPAGHSSEKRESVYRACSSDGLPDGCYRVNAGRHYWVMRKKEESAVGSTTAGTTAHLSGSISDTQATVASSPMACAAVKSTVRPSTASEDALARSTTDGRSMVNTPVTPEDAMSVAEKLLPEKTDAHDDASSISAAIQQKKKPNKRRKYTKGTPAADRNADSPPLVDTLLSLATPTKETLPPRQSTSRQRPQKREDASQCATSVVDDVEVALSELNSNAPHSARVSAILEASDLGALDVVSSSQKGRQQRTRARAKTSRVHVDAVGEEGKSNEAVSNVHHAQKEMTRDSAHVPCDRGWNGELVSAVPHVEERVELATDSPKTAKTSRSREKRPHSNEPTSESPVLGRARETPSKTTATSVEVGKLETASVAADLMVQSTATSDETKCAASTSPAHKSRKSKAATSATSSFPTPDAADTATLSKAPMPPLHGLPLHHEQSEQEFTNERLSHANKYTAATAQEDEQQQQQALADPSTVQSTAPTTSDTTQNTCRSNCGNAEAQPSSAHIRTPPADHHKEEQHLGSTKQPGHRHTPLNPSLIQSQAGTSRSTSNKNSQRGSLSPSAQSSSPWGASAGGAFALPELQEDMLNASSGRGSFLPSDSPALGFTQVRNTLAEEFSIDMSESESSSAASEYLYDVEG